MNIENNTYNFLKHNYNYYYNELVGEFNKVIQEQKQIIRQQHEQLEKQSKVLRYLYKDIDQLLKTELNTNASTLTARVYSSRSTGNKSIDSLAVGLTDIQELVGSNLRV